MANLLYANNAVGTLASGITNSQLTLTLNAGQAVLFPAPIAPQVFYATITDAGTQLLKEIVKVTIVTGNIFSIVRAQDGTSALSWNAGDIVEQCAIRLEFQNFENAAEGLFSTLAVPITPSTTLGIVGTTVGDNANAGSVGEFLTATSPVPNLANGVVSSGTSLALTAGDWDVWGVANFTTAGGGTLVSITAGVSASPTSLGGIGTYTQLQLSFVQSDPQAFSTPVVRVNLSASAPYYTLMLAYFNGSGATAAGTAVMNARRVR